VTAKTLTILILVLGNNPLWKWENFLTFQWNLLPPFSRYQCKSCRKIIYDIHMERREGWGLVTANGNWMG
jgi:hypothetical protein